MSTLQTVAALYDIHGNAPALAAVLQELATLHRTEPIDALVIGGDTVSGPLPGTTLELLAAVPYPIHLVRGNADREVVDAYDALQRGDAAALQRIHPTSVWAAGQLSRTQRDLLAGAQPTVVLEIAGLGRVCCCHGSPRSDEESITRVTSDERLRRILHGTPQPVVLCGHTHVQFDRHLPPWRVVNAGSVGMPYQDQPGAYWTLLGTVAGATDSAFDTQSSGERSSVALRRTTYDADAAAHVIRSATPPMPDAEDFITMILRDPISADAATAQFERQALEREAADLP